MHFAQGNIGEALLACSGLFCLFALAYFLIPRIFHRQMNEKLGRLHFWANVIGLLLFFAFPVYFNLAFQTLPGESKVDRFFRSFGASLNSYAWEIGTMLIVQVLLLANILWTVFKGPSVVLSREIESSMASSKG
jgi:heme/copper-type cytochrome/quinol oxidase subunit 1